MTKPSKYHKQGYNCAEAIIKSYNEEHNTDIPIALGSGMGVGLSVGSICGAVNAASMIIGYLKGRNDASELNEARKYTKDLMNNVRAEYNTEICSILKKDKVDCGNIIDFAYERVSIILKDKK